MNAVGQSVSQRTAIIWLCVTFIKSILCILAALQLVLPGCICKVLEPLGFDVPHHGHFGRSALENRKDCKLSDAVLCSHPGDAAQDSCFCEEQMQNVADERLQEKFSKGAAREVCLEGFNLQRSSGYLKAAVWDRLTISDSRLAGLLLRAWVLYAKLRL